MKEHDEDFPTEIRLKLMTFLHERDGEFEVADRNGLLDFINANAMQYPALLGLVKVDWDAIKEHYKQTGQVPPGIELTCTYTRKCENGTYVKGMTPSEKLEYVLHWVWSCSLQLQRHSESMKEERNCSLTDPVERQKIQSRIFYDAHVFVAAARNLVRAIDLAVVDYPQLADHMTHGSSIRLLRNIYEHWDEVLMGEFSTAAQEFARAFPQGNPFSIIYTSDGAFVAGTLPLSEFVRQLSELENRILALQREAKATS